MMVNERMAYSPMEAASTLGLCLNSIYKMIKRGQLKGIRVDRKILIPKTELERLLAGQSSFNPPSGNANESQPLGKHVKT